MTPSKSQGLRTGVNVFLGLLVLSILEYLVATGLEIALPLLVVIMLAKTALIVEYYMHLRGIKDTGDGGH